MKRFLCLIVVALLTWGANAQATRSYKVKTSRISFANETAAKADTMGSSDSAFCVLPPLAPGGVLPDKIQLHLPNLMAGGDSCLVFLQLLPNDKNKAINNIEESYSEYPKVGDNSRVSGYATGTDVYKSVQIATWYNGDGAKTVTISPPDSAATPRIAIVIVETAGTPVITGMDSLATSTIFLSKIYQNR